MVDGAVNVRAFRRDEQGLVVERHELTEPVAGAGIALDDLARFSPNAAALLEEKHVLVVPGSSFNVDYTDHFRITLLPDEETMSTVFARMESLLAEM